MRGRPYTSRPVPTEVGDSPGRPTARYDGHGPTSHPAGTSRDLPPPPPRPRTTATTAVLSDVDGCESINYYSARYRSRHAIPHGRPVLSATQIHRKTSVPNPPGQSAESRVGYPHEEHFVTDLRKNSSTNGNENVTRADENSSRRPRTSQRKNSDVITPYSEFEIHPLKKGSQKEADKSTVNRRSSKSGSGNPQNFADSTDKEQGGDERAGHVTGRGEKTKRRSYSGVTFVVPQATAHSFTRGSASHRRMSAPELPPIVDRGGHGGTPRGDKRKTSVNSVNSSGSKASTSHPDHNINGKTLTSNQSNYTASVGVTSNPATSSSTKKKKGQLPRNYSDPSLTRLPGNSSTVSHDSSSTTLSQSTANGGGGDVFPGAGPRHIKFLAKNNRALSWCATDNLGSQGKLETLFEGQSNHNNNNTTNHNQNINNTAVPAANINHLSTSPPSHQPARFSLNKTSSNGSSTNIIAMVSNANAVNNNTNNHHHHYTDMPPIIQPGMANALGHRSRKDVSRRQSFTKKPEDGTTFLDSPRTRMKRSNSENKLSNRQDFISENQQRALQRVEARNFSVDRNDRFASPPRPNTKSMAPAPNARNRLHRSVTTLNVNNNNNNGHESKIHESEDALADDESYEKNERIFKWVIEVSNVDEFDTDPKDAYVEYNDETPQTDTAIHLVYGE